MKFYKKIVFSLLANSVLFWLLNKNFDEVLAPHIGGNFEIIGSWKSFLFLAVLFGFLNWFIKPLIDLISLPLRFITIGFFSFIINALMLFLLEFSVNFLQFFDTKLEVSGLTTYLIVGLILSLANGFIHWLED